MTVDQPPCLLLDLPEGVLFKVLEQLPAFSLQVLCQTTKRLLSLLINHDQAAVLWRAHCREVLGSTFLTLHEASFSLAAASSAPGAQCRRYRRLLSSALRLDTVHWWDQGAALLRRSIEQADMKDDVQRQQGAAASAQGGTVIGSQHDDTLADPPLWASVQQAAGVSGIRDCLQTRCQRSGHSITLCGPFALVTGGILRLTLPHMDVLCVHLDTLTVTRDQYHITLWALVHVHSAYKQAQPINLHAASIENGMHSMACRAGGLRPALQGPMPRARFRHSCCLVDKAALQGSKLLNNVEESLGPDSLTEGHLLLVFGGYNAQGEEFGGHELEVLWVSGDGAVVRWCHVATWGPVPAHVYHHTADLVAQGRKMLVCGGESSWFHNRQSRSPIVYLLDLQTLVWTQQETQFATGNTAVDPGFQGQRSLHISTVYNDPSSGHEQLVVVAGYFGNQLADMWAHALDLTTWVWTRGPRARHGPLTAEQQAQGLGMPRAASNELQAPLEGLWHPVGPSGVPLGPSDSSGGLVQGPADGHTGCAPPPPRQRAAGMRVGHWLLVHGGATANGISLGGLHRLHLPTLCWHSDPVAVGEDTLLLRDRPRIAGHCLAGGLSFGGCMATIMGVLPISKLELLLLVDPQQAAALGAAVPPDSTAVREGGGAAADAAADSGSEVERATWTSSGDSRLRSMEAADAPGPAPAGDVQVHAGSEATAVDGGTSMAYNGTAMAQSHVAPQELYELVRVPMGGYMLLEMWRNTRTGQMRNYLPAGALDRVTQEHREAGVGPWRDAHAPALGSASYTPTAEGPNSMVPWHQGGVEDTQHIDVRASSSSSRGAQDRDMARHSSDRRPPQQGGDTKHDTAWEAQQGGGWGLHTQTASSSWLPTGAAASGRAADDEVRVPTTADSGRVNRSWRDDAATECAVSGQHGIAGVHEPSAILVSGVSVDGGVEEDSGVQQAVAAPQLCMVQ